MGVGAPSICPPRSLLAIGLVLSEPSQLNWILLSLLLGVYYVNAASWMYLSSILEKRGNGKAATREMTSVTMPTGIVEGTETVIAYFLFLLFPDYLFILFSLFSFLVILTIIQRFVWAKGVLS